VIKIIHANLIRCFEFGLNIYQLSLLSLLLIYKKSKMKASTAVYQLKTFPETFLRNNLLIIAGVKTSGVINNYYIESKDSANSSYNEAFKFTNFSSSENKDTVAVHNVRMIPISEDFKHTAIESYPLTGGPDLMITGQLTGCTFVTANGGGSTLVAHIQPGGSRGSGQELRDNVLKNGRFKNHANQAVTVFGVGDYQGAAYVVGVRIGGQWQLYGQMVTGPGTNAQITSVKRIA